MTGAVIVPVSVIETVIVAVVVVVAVAVEAPPYASSNRSHFTPKCSNIAARSAASCSAMLV